MEIKTLRYFLETAKEENMSKAAKQLHISQSTISKQLKSLEEELGQELFIRHSFSIELTEEGKLLKKRAVDLLKMADKIQEEFSALDIITGGHIYLGCAETYSIRYLAQIIQHFKLSYPDFKYHITSGDTEQVTASLNQGLLDFALIVEKPNPLKYNALKLPEDNKWGIILRADHPLAKNKSITIDDLIGIPLFCSEQSWKKDIPRWCGERIKELHLEGSFVLPYNGSVFVKEGLGCLLTFEHLIDTSPKSGLVFRPLCPELKTSSYIIWKKEQVFTPIARRFLKELKSSFKPSETGSASGSNLT